MNQKSFTLQGFKPSTDKFSKDNDRALRILQSEKPIVVLPADKGRAAVILNREYLSEKCIDHKSNIPYE